MIMNWRTKYIFCDVVNMFSGIFLISILLLNLIECFHIYINLSIWILYICKILGLQILQKVHIWRSRNPEDILLTRPLRELDIVVWKNTVMQSLSSNVLTLCFVYALLICSCQLSLRDVSPKDIDIRSAIFSSLWSDTLIQWYKFYCLLPHIYL